MALEEWFTTKDPKSLLKILAEHGHDIRELAVDIIRRNDGPPTYTDALRMFDELYSHGHPYSGNECYNHDHWDHGLLQPDCPDPLTSFGLLYGKLYLGEDAVRLDCAHIREVANPFAPALNFDWLTETVKLLVNSMLRQGDFSAMPILADALQDAGCDESQILDHCRCAGAHSRRCWVLSLLTKGMGKLLLEASEKQHQQLVREMCATLEHQRRRLDERDAELRAIQQRIDERRQEVEELAEAPKRDELLSQIAEQQQQLSEPHKGLQELITELEALQQRTMKDAPSVFSRPGEQGTTP